MGIVHYLDVASLYMVVLTENRGKKFSLPRRPKPNESHQDTLTSTLRQSSIVHEVFGTLSIARVKSVQVMFAKCTAPVLYAKPCPSNNGYL